MERRLHLQVISRGSEGLYEVVLKADDEEVPRTFHFRVNEGNILVVSWPEEFDRYMNYNTGPAKYLFEAVLNFHRAQLIRLPL